MFFDRLGSLATVLLLLQVKLGGLSNPVVAMNAVGKDLYRFSEALHRLAMQLT